jgi:Antibiotic biosynthesis monooxygenase
MITLFERDTVSDFATWHKAFADFAPTLKQKGVIASAVYRSVDNPNDITVAHDFNTLAEAQAFIGSAELRRARPGAGVVNSPTIWFASKV